MSGRQRNIIPIEKVSLQNRKLPEVICESPVNSPGQNFGEEISADIGGSAKFLKENGRFRYNSTVSSAQSQKFQDLFYKTDWPSLSDTETDSPDCIELEGSDSSASSMFSWADAEGTRRVAEEWEKIERTLYDESGPKVTQKHLIEECNQWKSIFPHLRVVGRSCHFANTEYDNSYDTEEEVLALSYDSDGNSEEVNNLYSSNQENKHQKLLPLRAKKTKNEKANEHLSPYGARTKSSTKNLVEELDSYLHITPISQRSSSNIHTYRNRTSSIIKSEISSSRWRQRNGSSPDFVSLPYQSINENNHTRDSSAASLYSNNYKKKNINNASGTLWNGNKRQMSAVGQAKNNLDKNTHFLEPIDLTNRNLPMRSISISIPHESEFVVRSSAQKNRNISLPPIQSDENKGRRKNQPNVITFSGKSIRTNKKTLTPINLVANTLPKQNIGMDTDAFSLIDHRSATNQKRRNKKFIKNKL